MMLLILILILIGCRLSNKVTKPISELDSCFSSMIIDSLVYDNLEWDTTFDFSFTIGGVNLTSFRGIISNYPDYIIDEFRTGLDDYSCPLLRLKSNNDSIDLLYGILSHIGKYPLNQKEPLKDYGLIDLSDYPFIECGGIAISKFLEKHFEGHIEEAIALFEIDFRDLRISTDKLTYKSETIQKDGYKIITSEMNDTLHIPKMMADNSDMLFVTKLQTVPFTQYYISYWDKLNRRYKRFIFKYGLDNIPKRHSCCVD